METRAIASRDASLDYLKCIALLGLVIAHVSKNVILLQARVFDVNLLVIISAMLGCRGLEQRSMENDHKYIYIYILDNITQKGFSASFCPRGFL